MKLRTATQEQPTPPPPVVAIKGSGDGLRVEAKSDDAAAVVAELRALLDRRGAGFFRGARVELEVPGEAVDGALVAGVAGELATRGIALTGVITAGARRPAPQQPVPPALSGSALFTRGTVRSGQRVEHNGPVVVLGDVNPGAEVRAGGSVVVWGRVRGAIAAGLTETDGVVVCALDLAPTHLQIGEARARAPEEPQRAPEPEMAFVRQGAIVVERWR